MRILVLFTFLSVFFSSSLFADTFYVLHVDGLITNLTTNARLKTGEKIKTDDALLFKDENAMVVFVDSDMGRMMISGIAKDEEVVVKEKMTKAPDISTLKTGVLKTKSDFQDYFSDTLLILDKATFNVSKDNFPLDENHFFQVEFLFYSTKIENTLPSDGNQFTVSENEIYAVDGNRVSTSQTREHKLYYIDKSKGEKIYLTDLRINIPILYNVKIECNLLKQILINDPKHTEDTIKAEIISHLNHVYGIPQMKMINNWIDNL